MPELSSITQLKTQLASFLSQLRVLQNQLTQKISRQGDRMSGPFFLSRDPQDPLEAVTLRYLQAHGGGTGSGSVTSVIAGPGLTGGTITSSGTIGLSTTGIPGTTFTFPTINFDVFGRAVSASDGLAANGSQNGYLSSADWTSFTAKEPGLGNPSSDGMILSSTTAGVRSWVTNSGGFLSSTGTPVGVFRFPSLEVHADGRIYDIGNGVVADSTHDGYVLFTDWNRFNAKEPPLGNPISTNMFLTSSTGGVRSWVTVPTTFALSTDVLLTGLAPGDVVSWDGTHWINNPAIASGLANTGVTAGSYLFGSFTVQADGRLTAATACPPATSSVNGYLTSTDWSTFNSKEPSLGVPSSNGYALVSTTGGTRSWVAIPAPGSTTLAGDTDVQIVSPALGDTLLYDTTANKWLNSPAGVSANRFYEINLAIELVDPPVGADAVEWVFPDDPNSPGTSISYTVTAIKLRLRQKSITSVTGVTIERSVGSGDFTLANVVNTSSYIIPTNAHVPSGLATIVNPHFDSGDLVRFRIDQIPVDANLLYVSIICRKT